MRPMGTIVGQKRWGGFGLWLCSRLGGGTGFIDGFEPGLKTVMAENFAQDAGVFGCGAQIRNGHR